MAPSTTSFETPSSPCSPSPSCSFSPPPSSSSEKRFVCPECSQTFQRSEHLRRHTRTHSGLRPFACTFPGCNKTFSRSDNMAMHQRSHIQKNSRKIIRELKAKEKLLQAEREKLLGGKEYQFVVENGLVKIPKKTFHPYRPDPLFHQLLSDELDQSPSPSPPSSSSSSSSTSYFDRASSPLSSSPSFDSSLCDEASCLSPTSESNPSSSSSSSSSPSSAAAAAEASSPCPLPSFAAHLSLTPLQFDPSFTPQISLPPPLASTVAAPREAIDRFYLALF